PIHLRAVFGSPVANAADSLRIANPGTLDLAWTLSSSDAWLGLSNSGGKLAGGERLSIPIGLSSAAQSFTVGTYTVSLALKNTTDGGGDSIIPVELAVEQPKSVLVFGEASGSGFGGGFGGPFSPSSLAAQLRNTGNIQLTWSGTVSVPWLTIRPTS